LQDLYHFFWKRWYIDNFYNRVFVTGTLKISSFVADVVEQRYDDMVHTKFPAAFVKKPYEVLRDMHTDTRQVLYNVSYVLAFFLVLLLVFFKTLGD
jgi:NADH:ubiquinone oxidoreductase subunit 5 (subunit L)/multisubunit Na+/H+ antiporter MnhA subunit